MTLEVVIALAASLLALGVATAAYLKARVPGPEGRPGIAFEEATPEPVSPQHLAAAVAYEHDEHEISNHLVPHYPFQKVTAIAQRVQRKLHTDGHPVPPLAEIEDLVRIHMKASTHMVAGDHMEPGAKGDA